MDINEKSYLMGICNWLIKQPEHKEFSKEDKRSIFYHISEMQYAELILRFIREEENRLENDEITVFEKALSLEKAKEIAWNVFKNRTLNFETIPEREFEKLWDIHYE